MSLALNPRRWQVAGAASHGTRTPCGAPSRRRMSIRASPGVGRGCCGRRRVVVAEWRDAGALMQDHIDNAAIDPMLEGGEGVRSPTPGTTYRWPGWAWRTTG